MVGRLVQVAQLPAHCRQFPFTRPYDGLLHSTHAPFVQFLQFCGHSTHLPCTSSYPSLQPHSHVRYAEHVAFRQLSGQLALFASHTMADTNDTHIKSDLILLFIYLYIIQYKQLVTLFNCYYFRF